MIIVTIPAKNEEKTIGEVVARVHRTLYKHPYVVLVACNVCTDRTGNVAKEAGALIFDVPEQGLANVFRAEMRETAKYPADIIVHIDADGQYSPAVIPELLRKLQEGYEMVLGNRLWHRPDGMPVTKYVFNQLGSLGYSTMLRKYLPDITTGLRVFTADVARIGANLTSEYTYTQELTWRVIKARMKVASVDVNFYPRTGGNSRLMSGSAQYLTRSAKDFWRFSR